MYDELIKALRFCAMTELSEEEYPCDPCKYEPPKKYHIRNELCYLGCFQQMMLHAADAIELLQKTQQPRWIPVSERLPDFEGAVLCMRKSYIHQGMRHQEIMYVDEKGFCNVDDVYAEPGNITHWMPLPTPPKGEEE